MKKFKRPDGGLRGRPDFRGRLDPRGRSDSRGRPDSRMPKLQHASVPQGRCVVGIHAVNELLKVRANGIEQLWLREKFQDHPDLKQLHDMATQKGVRIQLQSPGRLDRVISSHQGIMAFTREQPELNWQHLEKLEQATLIALDEVEDPHNLGAVLRTAWLMGAQGILIPEHRAAHLSPAVSKVAQGAAEHVPVESSSALPETLKQLKDRGFWILALSHKAKQTIFQLEIPQKVVWVLGSESSGLRKSVEGACDDFVSIPQAAPEASYNVSVAAGIALAETFRQRR